MPVAPTPPTRPSPPVVPAVTPANANAAGNPPPAPAPANPNQLPGKTASPAAAGAARELEGLGKAWQGNGAPPTAEARTEPAVRGTETNSLTTPARPLAAEAGVAARTTVPAPPPVPEARPAGFSYFPFVVIIAVTAAVFWGLRLCKHKKAEQRTVIDYSQRTTAVMDQDGLDIVVSPPTTAPKVKQNFEFRV